ncbi:MAG: DUF2442 domain-containing protein [Geobacter sp.]|nr:DUF2442 domain-containing protein [Geobacter sp.]
MKPYHVIDRIEASQDKLCLVVDGNEYQLLWSDISPNLAAASMTERNRLEVSPAGYGIHWPLLDEDLSIDGLIGIQHELPPVCWPKKAA